MNTIWNDHEVNLSWFWLSTNRLFWFSSTRNGVYSYRSYTCIVIHFLQVIRQAKSCPLTLLFMLINVWSWINLSFNSGASYVSFRNHPYTGCKGESRWQLNTGRCQQLLVSRRPVINQFQFMGFMVLFVSRDHVKHDTWRLPPNPSIHNSQDDDWLLSSLTCGSVEWMDR